MRLHCTLSNLWAPNFNWEILDVMQAEKYMGPLFSIVPLILQRLCDDQQCLILLFSVIYLDSAQGDILGGQAYNIDAILDQQYLLKVQKGLIRGLSVEHKEINNIEEYSACWIS